MNRKSIKKAAIIYFAVTVFCLIFFLIYDRFSHDVRSPFMTFLFAWPFVLGAVPCGLLLGLHNPLLYPNRLAANLYNSALASVTVSSAMRGVFDIAGTSSVYQSALMIAGFAFLSCAVTIYISSVIRETKLSRLAKSSPDQSCYDTY